MTPRWLKKKARERMALTGQSYCQALETVRKENPRPEPTEPPTSETSR